MAKNKTVFTDENVIEFIENLENDIKKKDSFQLIDLMREIIKCEPKMWGPSIIGFGEYHYKYASGHEGNAPVLGFSPRKAAISLYVFSGADEHLETVEKLGKFTMGKSCIYVKKMIDIDTNVLNELMQQSIDFVSEKYQRIS
nr:DUF1801 domain-containing protein [uncultured Flavobacterium sp.]